MATNTERQAAFKARMRAEGKKLIAVWVSPEQEKAIKAYLAGKGLLPVMPPAQPDPDPDYQQWAAMLEAREAEREQPEPVAPAKPEKAPERASADPFIARTFKKPKPEPVKPTLAKVEPSKPDRISEYLVLDDDDQQLGRVWQVNEKPKWRGYPSGFNEKQYSGNTQKEVVERIRRYKSL